MPGQSVNVTLGKDVTITGVNNARSCTVTNSASDVDVTKFGDTFTISGTETGNATYICTKVAESQPLDGIVTYAVSGSRTVVST